MMKLQVTCYYNTNPPIFLSELCQLLIFLSSLPYLSVGTVVSHINQSLKAKPPFINLSFLSTFSSFHKNGSIPVIQVGTPVLFLHLCPQLVNIPVSPST
ncbi:hypothetical protein JHK82_013691 [Glycine max]|uniref:Uncharacterized protein n=2 Tax=Glycine subgen. Soja TaxID=1462606 RepID=A0A0R0K625_SOYBN|nr:hypothetical protein JHK87_013608 [Glycine soja]KAG5041589.1 hypothetical protein JHK85_014065 [Glycine max]KAG5058710.1 hypothetical protein JHK86_013706 [Glycine max]KAG5155722.1 hypothetical protein JHK82_013691 [Glycine max]KAH1135756.1 hypothetical protein GYH30_013464 [Glycine max]